MYAKFALLVTWVYFQDFVHILIEILHAPNYMKVKVKEINFWLYMRILILCISFLHSASTVNTQGTRLNK